MEEEKTEKNYYYIILVLLTITAFLIRIEVIRALLAIDTNILYPSSVTDMATYYKLGLDISKGTFSQVYYYQPFYYAFFLAWIFRLIPGEVFSVLVVQALLGAMTVYFSAQSAKRLCSKNAGLITAFLVTFSQVLIFYTSYMLIVTLQAFLIIMLLYFSLVAYEKKGSFYWGLTALMLGCSVLTRGNMWLLVPPFMLIILIRGIINNRGRGIIKKILPFTVFCIFLFLPMIPYVYTNSVKSGTFTGPSTAAGAVLLFGDTPESPPGGNEVQYGIGIMAPTFTGEYWQKTSNKIPIIRRIYEYWKKRPLVYAELTFRKLLLFWDMREIPNNVDINKSYDLCRSLKIFGFIPTFMIMVLGGAGLLFFIPSMFFKKSRFILPFCIFGVYWISISLFYILCRFRAPIIPVLAVYSGCIISILLSYTKEKGRNISLAILLIVLFTIISIRGYSYYRFNLEKKVLKYITPNGISVDIDNSVMVFDNGPMLYGSWKLISLKDGILITKRFILPDCDGKSELLLEMPVLFTEAGDAIFEIEKKIYCISADKNEKLYLNCPINECKKTKIPGENNFRININILVKKITGNSFIVYDGQRNYGRSFINDRKLNGELIAKIFIETSK